MSPSIAILLSGLLQSILKLLEREFSQQEKEAAEETGERFAVLLTEKETEVT